MSTGGITLWTGVVSHLHVARCGPRLVPVAKWAAARNFGVCTVKLYNQVAYTGQDELQLVSSARRGTPDPDDPTEILMHRWTSGGI